MKTNYRTDTLLTNQRGASAIMIALGLTIFLGMAALAVDIGYREVEQNEIQNIVDASALAGAGELGRQYLDGDPYDEPSIVAIAQEVANSNETGFNIQVEVGTWRNHDEGFIDDDCTVIKCNAVKAIAVRDSDNNTQVPTFFARIWNINGLDILADAVAALTGASEVAEGDLEIPVGISREWFEDDFCDHDIQFYPTAGTTGCAGWHVYEDWPANAAHLRDDILGGLLTGDYVPPALNLEDDPSFAFTGGNLSTTIDNMSALFDARREWVVDDDGVGKWVWKTKVVVYDEPCGENPNQTIPIIGFATVEITGVVGPPPVLIATAKCGEVNAGNGGGNYYGTWGSIPGLVE